MSESREGAMEQTRAAEKSKNSIDEMHLLDFAPSEIDPKLGSDTQQEQEQQKQQQMQEDEDEKEKQDKEDQQSQSENYNEDNVNIFSYGEAEASTYSPNLQYPLPGQVSNAFQKKQFNKLSDLLRDINKQLPLSIRNEQILASKRINKAEATIKALRNENLLLKEQTRESKALIKQLRNGKTHIESEQANEIERLKAIIEDARKIELNLNQKIISLEHNGQVNDSETRRSMTEALTFLNCNQYEEDQDGYYFSIQQKSSIALLNYRLIINKENPNNEVLYIPDWESPDGYAGDWDQNIVLLKDLLPASLQSDLLFNADNLHSFYCKINECLKRKG